MWRRFRRRLMMLDPKTRWTAGESWTAKELRNIPELRHFPGTHRGARRAAVLHPFTRLPQSVLCVGLALVWFVPWLLVAGRAAWVSGGEPSIGRFGLLAFIVVWFGGTVLGFAIGAFAPILAIRNRIRLRSELRRRGIPICIRCGYEGGDISAPRCPECGAIANP